MALLDTTVPSLLPRETLKLVRAEVLAGLVPSVPSEAPPAQSKMAQTVAMPAMFAMPAKAAMAQTVAMQASPAKAIAQTIALQARPAKALERTMALQQGNPAKALLQTIALQQANPAKAVLAQTLFQAERPKHPSSGMVRVAAPLAAPVGQVSQGPAIVAPVPMRTCAPTADPRLMMLADPDGAQAASFRLLRDTLIAKGLPRVLAVTSPESGDGKTTCAINLALALAERRGESVLVVDCNFADPALGGMLGIEKTPDPAPSRAWTAPFTLAALTPSLHVATVARRPGSGHVRSSYVDFTTFARQLDTFQRAGYQHIILDMPTLDSSSEAKLLLQVVGGVLLAVRCGSSKTTALRRAVDQIGAGKALGITLLDSPG